MSEADPEPDEGRGELDQQRQRPQGGPQGGPQSEYTIELSPPHALMAAQLGVDSHFLAMAAQEKLEEEYEQADAQRRQQEAQREIQQAQRPDSDSPEPPFDGDESE